MNVYVIITEKIDKIDPAVVGFASKNGARRYMSRQLKRDDVRCCTLRTVTARGELKAC